MLCADGWYARGKVETCDADFLVDSGSTYTIIDVEIYNSLSDETQATLKPVDISLKDVGGHPLDVWGAVDTYIKLKGHAFPCSAVVADLGGEKAAIIGLSFMKQYDCEMSMKRGTLKFLDRSVTKKPFTLKLHMLEGALCARITVESAISIPPRSEMIVSGQFMEW